MKKYCRLLLLLIISSSFFTGCSSKFDSKEICLNTDSMKEAGDQIIYSQHGNAVIDAYICAKKNAKNDTFPWADVFLCKFYNSTNIADTVILIDTKLRKRDIKESYNVFWLDLKPAQRLKKCKVLIPRDLVISIKKFRYRYAHVSLVTDD